MVLFTKPGVGNTDEPLKLSLETRAASAALLESKIHEIICKPGLIQE